MEVIGTIWNTVIQEPMINGLMVMYKLFGDNFGISILIFTVIIRVITLQMTLKQIRMTREMS